VRTTSRVVSLLFLALLASSTIPLLASAVLPVFADVTLTKTVSATWVVSGTSVSYLYNVTNTGETILTGSITDDQFGPVGSFVNLHPGGWVAFNVTHVITATTTNFATVWAEDEYGTLVTDSATVTVTVANPNMVPEAPFGTVLAAATMVIAFGVYVANPKRRKNRQ
jgi:hypothetical protein